MRSKIQNKIFDCDFSEFNPIPLLLKREKVQNFRLKPNSNIVKLFYSSSDARSEDPTIIYGVDCHMPWALHRYYLYPFSGQILIGSKWLKKIGTYECAKSNMRIVDPLVAYQDKSGEVHLGKEIINAGELDLAQFNIEQFDVHLNAIPY
jgi:hypothetical protein